MKNSILFYFLALSLLSSCNVFSPVDSPSGDEQHLSAGDACLDRGDYECALKHYNALSSKMSDIKTERLAFETLAANNIFLMSELITSLGTSRGGGASFAILAQTMAAKGKIDGATRTTIQTVFASASSITDPGLKSYVKFIAALSMFSSVLGSAVGADGMLTKTDIATTPATCTTGGAACAVAASGTETACLKTNDLTNTTTQPSMDSATGWSAAATLGQLVEAANQADSNLATMTGGSSSLSGLMSAIDVINSSLGGVSAAACYRQVLINNLF